MSDFIKSSYVLIVICKHFCVWYTLLHVILIPIIHIFRFSKTKYNHFHRMCSMCTLVYISSSYNINTNMKLITDGMMSVIMIKCMSSFNQIMIRFIATNVIVVCKMKVCFMTFSQLGNHFSWLRLARKMVICHLTGLGLKVLKARHHVIG